MTARNAILFGVIFGVLAVVGLFVHELGHGLTAMALGGKLDELAVFPGIEIYPDFGRRWTEWRGYVAVVRTSGVSGDAARGLVVLMGSGTTLLMASGALALLYRLRPTQRIIEYGLIALSLHFLDILTYTFLPLIGLRHWIIIGGKAPEPLQGAERLGIPRVLFMGVIIIIAGALSGLIIRYWYRRGENAHGKEITDTRRTGTDTGNDSL